MTSLRNINLNLIPVLQALLHERSVAGAAEGLDLSPAATSEALAKLRILLEDPLLVRAGRNMELTPRAQELIASVDHLCETADALLRRDAKGFDPARSRRLFRLASNDMLTRDMAAPLLRAVRAQSSTVQLHFLEAQHTVAEQMTARQIDLLVMPQLFTDSLSAMSPIRFRTLFKDRLVVVFSAQHPLAGTATLDMEDLSSYPQLHYNPPPEVVLEGRREREVLGGARFNVAARLPQLALIPSLLVGSPYVSWLPHSLVAPLLGPLSLEMRETPMPTPSIDVCMAWSSVFDADPGHTWLRELAIATLTR